MQFLLLVTKKKLILIAFSLLIPYLSVANKLVLSRNIQWEEKLNITKNDSHFPRFISFNSSYQSANSSWLPYFNDAIRLNNLIKNVSITIQNISYEENTNSTPIQNQTLLNTIKDFDQTFSIGTENGKSIIWFKFLPLSNNASSGNILLIKSFEILINYDLDIKPSLLLKKAYTTTSVLANGQWIKLGVTKTGFHKLDAAFFSACGINISSVDPRTIKIYGNGPGLLPQRNDVNRPDDLLENAIWVSGETDGVFNGDDYVLMYGKSQADVWKQDGNILYREKNIYSDTTYYYLTFNQGTGKRINKQVTSPTPVNTENSHIFCYAHEYDLVNIGRTGRQFLGEPFDKRPQQDFTVSVPGFLSNEPVYMVSSVAARSYISQSNFDVRVNNNPVFTHNINTVGTGYESPYFAKSGPLSKTFSSSTPTLNISYTYSLPGGGAIGWLDYFEINAKAALTWYDNQVLYRVLPGTTPGNTAYSITGSVNNPRLFNVTNGADVEELLVNDNSNQSTIINNTVTLTELAGINSSSTFYVPVIVGSVKNQNLHGLPQADVLYITPSVFYNQAVRLAAFHQQKGYKVHVVNVAEIYNEFSSGSQDISAIRDFIRMFYKRSTSQADRIKYVTLFGRASYDYKNRVSVNSNFVPTFQSSESSSPIVSYCSDDFFGFLDDTEGKWDSPNDSKEALDIGIGRLPISSETEAANAVNKIINYHAADKMANWRNKIIFVSDDEDNNIHQTDANNMADNVFNNFKNYNIEKIWIDAYKKEVISGGERYPDAQKAITDAVQKGAFIVNYTGHGGELGWAAERILTIEDIQSWTNINRLPLFVTATCEFSRFDDPARVSAGELTFLSTAGGTIGLFTTVRLVSAYSNTVLNQAFYRRVGLDSTSKINPLSLGEIMRLTKNDYTDWDKNERNFTLLGDAVMKLAYPKWNIATTSINNNPVASVTDTLKALSKITITGSITDLSGNVITSFNGDIFPTVYDKPSWYQTMVNSPKSSPALQFKVQNNIIYSGSASVINGIFSFSFVVPKDISYQIGTGKISYYATDNSIDANGYEERFLVGGTADSVDTDVLGPDIKLYMNDEKFVFGGMTNESPLFIAKLYDASGINTIGRGIGRELSLTIDNNLSKTIPLNDYYQSRKDSYTDGEVKYQLKDIAAGKHTVILKAWDTYNNSSESILEFLVANNEKMALQYVLNYPNPFTTQTTFHFDHNKAGESLNVMIQIYTIGGKLAKTLNSQTVNSSSHFSDIVWNGMDEYGDKLAKGVYIYKVIVKSGAGKSAEATQKLVILN